uniref:Metalloprotease TIKI homolog n=1 Tax=Trichuris muris TaxID=70415 RepID=A0A5S6QDP6_TRIMR
MLPHKLMILASILSQTHHALVTGGAKPSYCSNKSFTKSGRSNSFLWRIKRRPPSYFFGTIHVPYTEVWEYVNPTVKAAFYRADTVFLELDLNNPKTVQSLVRCQYLPEGEQLIDHLPPALFDRLKQHMDFVRQELPRWTSTDQYGPDATYADQLFYSITGNWERKRPIWIMFLLNSLNPRSIENRGIPVLDLYLAQQAFISSKPLGAIETPYEQCQPLNSLRNQQVVHALNQTLYANERLLTKHDRLKLQTPVSDVISRTYDLVKHYICGSLDETIFTYDSVQLVEKGNLMNQNELDEDEDSNINAYFRQELIQKRNNRMAKRVVFLLEKHPRKSFFFAFGAGHFLGKNSVIDLVRESGYDVRPVIMRKTGLSRGAKLRKGQSGRDAARGISASPHKQSLRPQTQQVSSLWQWEYSNAAEPVGIQDRGLVKSTGLPSTTTEQGRGFQELWIRINGYSPQPWHDIHRSIARTQTMTNYLVVQYYSHFASSGGATVGRMLPFPWFACAVLVVTVLRRIA